LKPFAAFVLLCCAASAGAQAPLPADVQAVIDRSHHKRGDYAVFLTTQIATPARSWTEIQAEFQQGASHRIEVSMERTLVNCDTGAGTAYDVMQARYREDEASHGVCGIDVAADPILSAKMLPPVSGPYGRADRIELTGEKFVRRYAVTADGIIVTQDYVPRRADVGFALHTLKAEVRRGRQPAEMFTRESLKRAFAPALPAPARSR
jgi:hypothetical protein